MEFFSDGLKKEFETVVVNEPSVFEPLKFYCIFSNKERSTELRCMGIRPCFFFYFHLKTGMGLYKED